MEIVSTIAVLCGLMLGLGWLLLSARERLKGDDNELIDAIDALLPQTQCTQCGFPGCRPYAEAVANGTALDLCPPGGDTTFEALKALLGRDGGTTPPSPEPLLARIREADCIGCFLCIRACPVDAIIGAPGFMHTVIEDECTGCGLCVPACPVDCIDLNWTVTQAKPRPIRYPMTIAAHESQPCIGCNRCEPACPAALAPRELLWLTAAEKWNDAEAGGLERCIECRLCDRVCPSNIPLAAIFGSGRRVLSEAAAKRADAAHAKARYQARNTRLAAEQEAAQTRRAARLARRVNPAKAGEATC